MPKETRMIAIAIYIIGVVAFLWAVIEWDEMKGKP